MIATSSSRRASAQDRAPYRLPWTVTNNPSGWIEVTTHCQLRCPGCYRGTGLPGWTPAHRPLREVMLEIDTLCRDRNIQALSISGGEPLLYPKLNNVVRHARSRNLEVLILSNGIALDTDRLHQLRDLGVSRMLLHIERNQQRAELDDEENVVFVINTPVLSENGEWNVCDGCPDAMLWKGNLIPSCLLQKAEAGEPVPILGCCES